MNVLALIAAYVLTVYPICVIAQYVPPPSIAFMGDLEAWIPKSFKYALLYGVFYFLTITFVLTSIAGLIWLWLIGLGV